MLDIDMNARAAFMRGDKLLVADIIGSALAVARRNDSKRAPSATSHAISVAWATLNLKARARAALTEAAWRAKRRTSTKLRLSNNTIFAVRPSNRRRMRSPRLKGPTRQEAQAHDSPPCAVSYLPRINQAGVMIDYYGRQHKCETPAAGNCNN
jgi:hypothetical protein